jgi:hypothetical protein
MVNTTFQLRNKKIKIKSIAQLKQKNLKRKILTNKRRLVSINLKEKMHPINIKII